MPRKKKAIKDLEQTHGMDESMPITLDQIFGETGNSKFGTLDEEEYASKLDEMNLSDLQAEAYKAGLIPVHNREILTKRLLSEFRKHAVQYTNSTVVSTRQTGEKPEAEKFRKIRNILSS